MIDCMIGDYFYLKIILIKGISRNKVFWLWNLIKIHILNVLDAFYLQGIDMLNELIVLLFVENAL